MKKISFSLLALCLFYFSSAQRPPQTQLNGNYVKEHILTKFNIPYPYLREADVMYAKRVWQVIDLRQKMDHPLYFPIEPGDDRLSLFDVIRHSLLVDQSMIAFGLGPIDHDDEFRYPLSHKQIDSLLNPIVEITYQSLNTEEDTSEYVPNPITSDVITQYKIKEDWIFDKQRSEMYVRIIGIMPMKEDYDDEGTKRGYRELFWLYYPNARYTLVNYPIFNPKNGALPLSFDDYLQKRLFSSYIVKEENVYNRSILAYSRGVDALLEAEKIKEELFRTEHDLWSY